MEFLVLETIGKPSDLKPVDREEIIGSLKSGTADSLEFDENVDLCLFWQPMGTVLGMDSNQPHRARKIKTDASKVD